MRSDNKISAGEETDRPLFFKRSEDQKEKRMLAQRKINWTKVKMGKIEDRTGDDHLFTTREKRLGRNQLDKDFCF